MGFVLCSCGEGSGKGFFNQVYRDAWIKPASAAELCVGFFSAEHGQLTCKISWFPLQSLQRERHLPRSICLIPKWLSKRNRIISESLVLVQPTMEQICTLVQARSQLSGITFRPGKSTQNTCVCLPKYTEVDPFQLFIPESFHKSVTLGRTLFSGRTKTVQI